MVEKKTTRKGRDAKKAAPAARAKTPAKAAPKKAAAAPAPPPAAPKKEKRARPARKEAAASPARPAPFGIHSLAPAPGSTHYRKRVGRGPGSGHGKTAGKGNKGQKSRTGYRHQRGFEGGQMPLHRRVPKRGFTNARFRKEYTCVNVERLEILEAGTVVTPDVLLKLGIVKKLLDGLKILGDGKLTKSLTVRAHKFSAKAQELITAAGGKVEVLEA